MHEFAETVKGAFLLAAFRPLIVIAMVFFFFFVFFFFLKKKIGVKLMWTILKLGYMMIYLYIRL